MTLASYRTLGRCGLVVSSLARRTRRGFCRGWRESCPYRTGVGLRVTRNHVDAHGVSRAEQVTDNAAALDIVLSSEHRATLDEVSGSADPRMLYGLFMPALRQHVVFGVSL